MATGTTYSDRVFLFRLQTLIIDGGTEVIRNIFDNRLQNQPLNVFLSSEFMTVNRLRNQKIISITQYDLLYPRSGQSPTSSDFDMPLMVCLLRNIPSLGLNQNYKWNVPPQTGDTSVEADICRLRVFRNEVAYISSTREFQQSTYQKKWSDVEQVLLRLNSTSPNPIANLSQTIDSYKNSPMDPAADQRFGTINEQWKDMEKGLETNVQLIRKDVTDTKKIIESIYRGGKRMRDDVREAKQDVKKMKQDVIYTRESVQEMKQHVEDTVKESIKQEMQNQAEKEREKAYDTLKSKLPGPGRRETKNWNS